MLEKKVSGVPAVEVKRFGVLSFDSDLTGEYFQFSGTDSKKVFIDFLLQASLYAPSVLKDYDVASVVDCVFDLDDDTFDSLLMAAGSREYLLSILAKIDSSFITAVFEDFHLETAYLLLVDVVNDYITLYDSLEQLLDDESGLSKTVFNLLSPYLDWHEFCKDHDIKSSGNKFFIW